jgi:hypothetical protein
VEVSLQTCRIARQETLSAVEYADAMMEMIDEVPEGRFKALQEIEKKLKIAKAYNRKVKKKSFQVDEFVWKMILPLGTKERRFGRLTN